MKTYELSGGSVRLWAEPGGPVMLRAIEASGDPVELGESEVLRLIAMLSALADQVALSEE
jgi:hypothetical protein